MHGRDIFRDDGWVGGEEFFNAVKTRKHGDIEHAAMFCCFDIVHHVPDKHRLPRIERVGVEDLTDFFPLIHDLGVGDFKILQDPESAALNFEM